VPTSGAPAFLAFLARASASCSGSRTVMDWRDMAFLGRWRAGGLAAAGSSPGRLSHSVTSAWGGLVESSVQDPRLDKKDRDQVSLGFRRFSGFLASVSP
jgi:hypothetical protein